jgi:hypothetical protein
MLVKEHQTSPSVCVVVDALIGLAGGRAPLHTLCRACFLAGTSKCASCNVGLRTENAARGLAVQHCLGVLDCLQLALCAYF